MAWWVRLHVVACSTPPFNEFLIECFLVRPHEIHIRTSELFWLLKRQSLFWGLGSCFLIGQSIIRIVILRRLHIVLRRSFRARVIYILLMSPTVLVKSRGLCILRGGHRCHHSHHPLTKILIQVWACKPTHLDSSGLGLGSALSGILGTYALWVAIMTRWVAGDHISLIRL